jgi:hypothetical protein
MYSYALLEPQCYYLVQEKDDSPIMMIKVTVESDHCIYITRYEETPVLEWKRKTDTLHEIIECMSDEKAKEWESVYKDNQDAYYEEEDDD